MRAGIHPRLESLESRMLLTALSPPASPSPEPLGFEIPGSSAAANVFHLFGPITFSSGLHALASQQASSVTLTLQRLPDQPSKTAIQVEVATGPVTNPSDLVTAAQPGVQYQPVVETINFPADVMSEPVTIPIVAGAANPGLVSFGVTAIQLGVKVDPSKTATEDVFLTQDINAVVARIDGAHLVLTGHRTSDIVLHFSQPMNPTSVQNRNAYYLQDSTYHTPKPSLIGGILGGSGVPTSASAVVKNATYNPSTNTVDLHLARSVDARDTLQIEQNSIAQLPPLLDAAGTPINEDGTGLGGSFLVTLSTKKVTIIDGVTQSVIVATPHR